VGGLTQVGNQAQYASSTYNPEALAAAASVEGRMVNPLQMLSGVHQPAAHVWNDFDALFQAEDSLQKSQMQSVTASLHMQGSSAGNSKYKRGPTREMWRKYGQKAIADDMIRSYYRCNGEGCGVKRQIVSSVDGVGECQIRTLGNHNHSLDGFVDKFNVTTLNSDGLKTEIAIMPQSGSGRAKVSKKTHHIIDEIDAEAAVAVVPRKRARTTELHFTDPEPADRNSSKNHPVIDLGYIEQIANSGRCIVMIDVSKGSPEAISMSESFTELTGYTMADIVGQGCSILDGKDTDVKARDSINEAFQNKSKCEIPILSYRKDGSKFWGMVELTPIRRIGEDGHETGITTMVATFSDVTTQNNATSRIDDRRTISIPAVPVLPGDAPGDSPG